MENIGSLSYTSLTNSDTFHDTISTKITFINSTTDLIRKVFKYWEAGKLMVMYTHFPKFKFSLESLNFIIDNKHCCQLFSSK